MKRSLLLSAMIMFGLLFTSCKKNNSYNMSTNQPQIQYQLVAANPNNNVATTPPIANLLWTSGFANPDIITFEAKQNNLSVEFKSTNKQQIDLMSSIATSFGGFVLPAGVYNEIELRIDLDKNGSTPDLQLNGQFNNGTVTLPVEFQVFESVELQTEQHNITISNDSSYVAVTTLDLSTVITGITATMLANAQLTNGTIVISSTSNTDLYKMVLDNLRNTHHHFGLEHHHE